MVWHLHVFEVRRARPARRDREVPNAIKEVALASLLRRSGGPAGRSGVCGNNLHDADLHEHDETARDDYNEAEHDDHDHRGAGYRVVSQHHRLRGRPHGCPAEPHHGATAKEKRLARILVRLTTHASSELDRATAASTAQKARLFRKANHTLARLRTLADKAETKGKLSVPVGPIDADVASTMSLAH